MPTVITEGAASARGFGFGASSAGENYIEDVFSTYLYTGNGSTQTITNGIDLSGKGGLVWMKSRSAATDHALYDTARGATFDLVSNSDAVQTTQATGLTAFETTGFSIGALAKINTSTVSYVSWAFRKQAKFFDIVTYTGTGANRTIAHSLGSVPGCIMVKRTNTTGTNWQVYHRSLANTQYMVLNGTGSVTTGATRWNSTTPTSSVFSVGTSTEVNDLGGTYVAYLFASNAGGFGAAGTDDVITCGIFNGDTTVTLGWEPQFIITKSSNLVAPWYMYDFMRKMTVSSGDQFLLANSSDPEASSGASSYISPTATGFVTNTYTGSDEIYIAIRRGPMKTPTDATKVFGISARTGTGANATVTGGQTDDAVLIKNRASAVASLFSSRLTNTEYLVTSSTNPESTAGTTILQANPWDVMDGVKVGTTSTITNASANTFVNYLFKRAPGFFDVLCYTGTGTTNIQNHNLKVAPDMVITKSRSSSTSANWDVNFPAIGWCATLNTTGGGFSYTMPVTSTTINVGSNAGNNPGVTHIAYLFATCPDISKVGSYTGTGATQTINCGFTGGARFVLIKRTDNSSDWYIWDTARGMVAGTDPSWRTNTTAAEVNANSVYTATTGFQIVSTSVDINASGGTYIFLAIA